MLIGYLARILLISQVSVSLFAQNTNGLHRKDTSSLMILRSVQQSAFDVGERLVYDIGYGFVIAGVATMEIPKTDTIQGRACYQVVFRVNSTPSFSWIYKVEDKYETYLDQAGIFPWRFVQQIREGKFSRDFAADFDQINNVARTTEGDFPIPPYVHDVVSAFYFVRTMDFSKSRVGEKIFLENFYKDKTNPLAVKFLGRQRIEVDAGTFDCIIIEPLVKEGGLFKSEGRVVIWMTDDERKIPVKVSTRILIGSLYAELREISGVNGPIKAKVR